MYLLPNGTIRLLRGCNIDKSFNHTLYFANESAQSAYFKSLTKSGCIFEKQSYSRVNKNTIRIGILADLIYDCNYMMFQNTNYNNGRNNTYSDKWFYAFIDKVFYINDNVCEVRFIIDPLQSYYFNYELGDCFIEREHTETDKIGENLIPESLECGDSIVNERDSYLYSENSNIQGLNENNQFELVIYYVPNLGGTVPNKIVGYTVSGNLNTYVTGVDQIGGDIVNGQYTGAYFFGIRLDLSDYASTVRNISLLIQKIQEVGGTIITIEQIPYVIWNKWILETVGTYGTTSNVHMQEIRKNNGVPIIPTSDTKTLNIDTGFKNVYGESFTPKNKKLYSYPYKSLVVSNNSGNATTYKWEDFIKELNSNVLSATFKIDGVPVQKCEISCYPFNYRGLYNNKDYESGINLSDMPKPSWNAESFASWWNKQKDAYNIALQTTNETSTIKGLWNTLKNGINTGLSTGSAEKMAIEAAMGIGDTLVNGYLSAMQLVNGQLEQISIMKNTPDELAGQIANEALRIIQNRIGFYFYKMSIKWEYAKPIDDFLTMFGYAIKKVKKPNIKKTNAHLRPHWNYIKTAGCVIHAATDSGLPAEAEDEISKIYDKGITFWTNGSEVGDYSLDNSPTV